MNEEIKIAEQAENAEAADNGDGNVEAVDNDNAASAEKLAKENARREEIQKYIDSLADKDVYDPNSYEVHWRILTDRWIYCGFLFAGRKST